MNLQESGEMYLETILVLSKKKNAVRSIDICEEMGFSKPSISRAIHLLEDGGYLEIDNSGFITLTDVGREIAEKIYERHTVLTELFMALGVDEETASEDACRIEHVISDKTFKAIKKHKKKYSM
ncbi:MAG: metal-dependent transcriptional regulator [Ruminiclostridium sp.]|nr:metal-dependent transcriptional regulator [Ruminiclostridium sp.]